MDPLYVGYLGVIALIGLIVLRVPIFVALASIGLAGLIYLMGLDVTLNYVPHQLYSRVANFTFTAIPLFLLMGYIAFYSGITTEAFSVARVWVGRVPAGLGISTILGCAIFAASAGSSLAECAAMSKIAVPEMEKSGYSRRLATGLVASAGGLAVVIPPSVIMIIYGVLTEQSVGKLLIAGILPGLLYLGVFAVAIFIFAVLRPQSAPLEPKSEVTWTQRVASLRFLWQIIILFTVSIGGIYVGLVTPEEAAALGACTALLLALVRGKLTWDLIRKAVVETVSASTIIFMLFVGAAIFTIFLTLTGVLETSTNWLISLNLSKGALFAALIVLFVILGSFLDAISIMLITLPLVLPILEVQGMSLIWFGVIMCMVVEIGCITPPMGLNIYVMKAALGKDYDLNDLFLGALPFVVLELIIVLILYLYPQIALLLPGLMLGG